MPARRASVVFVLITVFIDVLGMGLVIPIFPRLVQSMLGGLGGVPEVDQQPEPVRAGQQEPGAAGEAGQVPDVGHPGEQQAVDLVLGKPRGDTALPGRVILGSSFRS